MMPLWEQYYIEAINRYKSVCNERFEELVNYPNNGNEAIENLERIEQLFESVSADVQKVIHVSVTRIEGCLQ